VDDRRLIEDYLPIKAISAEASREKSVRKGHISTLHLWWARRPLVACRAAVYGALVPVSRFAPENGPDNKKQSLGRANAARFIERLCKYPGNPRIIAESQKHILEAHAQQLSLELKAANAGGAKLAWVEEFKFSRQRVTIEDIEVGRAPRPRVLDMFAGGGAIPLEALRLGCEAYALDLNPVAYIIELCTLVYPQNYGKPDCNVRGTTGPKNEKDEITWGGLASEVRYWGEWVLKKVKAEIGDLYPLIPDLEFKGKRDKNPAQLFQTKEHGNVPPGYLVPVAYLWTRTVKCKNPSCEATVPLVRQTWLCKKKGRFVAMKMVPDCKEKRVRFEVVETTSENDLGFDPEAGSRGGNATCPFCGTVSDSNYIKAEGCEKRIGQQLMVVVCTKPGKKGKVYLSVDDVPPAVPDEKAIRNRIKDLCRRIGLTVPNEPLPKTGTLGFRIQPYGIKIWGDLFTSRQMLCLLTFVGAVREAENEMQGLYLDKALARAITTFLGAIVDRLVDFNSSLCVFNYTGGRGVVHTFGRQALPMVWDFAETDPFNPEGASWVSGIEDLPAGLRDATFGLASDVRRGSATALPWRNASMDTVVTDPPYYDNVPYADISDFFYVWLKRTIGHLYPDHFAALSTPKKQEAVADATRHNASKDKARRAYEEMMAQAFREAHRVLKSGGMMVIVYAHKTTLGWATLVDALRQVGFMVSEAWPMETEKPGRLRAQDSAALASSIFLVARKREGQEKGLYETEVRPELEQIVRDRVAALWEMGVSGADLVIACVGAGLRAFTRFAHVEYANGEPAPAERFLSEVEIAVLDQILARLSKEVGGNGGRSSLAGVDSSTRFYIIWRYTYQTAELDAGEAIVFANGTHVELDGHGSLAYSARALVEKKKGKYRLRDFRERGGEEKLGLPADNGSPAPLIDALHRTLWLLRNRPFDLPDFLRKSGVNREQMRLVAQALAGPALKGGELGEISPTSELSALSELTANWRSVVEDVTLMPLEREARQTGQQALDFEKEKKK
jgi:putative DNA methylase